MARDRVKARLRYAMSNTTQRAVITGLDRLWLFPPVYVAHITEEYLGVGTARGIRLTSPQFLALTAAALLLMVVGIAIARRKGFAMLLQVAFGTAILVNGLSHTITSVAIAGYDPGVVTGLILFFPLGLLALFGTRGSMSERRFYTGIALGLAVQCIASVLAHSGNYLP